MFDDLFWDAWYYLEQICDEKRANTSPRSKLVQSVVHWLSFVTTRIILYRQTVSLSVTGVWYLVIEWRNCHILFDGHSFGDHKARPSFRNSAQSRQPRTLLPKIVRFTIIIIRKLHHMLHLQLLITEPIVGKRETIWEAFLLILCNCILYRCYMYPGISR